MQNFKIRAIVQFGSKTFGATGTNTVVFFLEKYNEPPKRKDMVDDSVEEILAGKELTDWEDEKIFEGYVFDKQLPIPITRAVLGNDAGLIGAAMLCKMM